MSSAWKRPSPLLKLLQRTTTRTRFALVGTVAVVLDGIHTSFVLPQAIVGDDENVVTRFVPL